MKKCSKNASEVNNFSFWCKNGTVFQNSCLNTDINLNKKELEDFILKHAKKILASMQNRGFVMDADRNV